MLRDSGVKILLTESRLLERLPQGTVETLCLDNEEVCVGQSEQNPEATSGADNLAYVMSSSG